MKKINIYILKFILVGIAIGLLLFHLKSLLIWFNVPIIVIYLILGFWFGKITCSIHQKSSGFWLTFILFTLLNLFHSLIDGTTVIALSSGYKNLAVYSHELIRQPALYVVFWAMLSPFNIGKAKKIIISILSITGLWIIGMYLGTIFGFSLQELQVNEVFLELSIFIFIGDIIHHLYDDFPNKNHSH